MGNETNSSNGIAIGGFVLAIISIVFVWLPLLNIILAIVGLILSVIGISKANKLPDKKNHGFALGGIIISAIFLVISLLVTIGAVAYMGVIEPSNLMPDQCISAAGFECTDYEISGSTMNVALKNRLGKSVTVSDFKITENGEDAGRCSTTNLGPVADSENINVICGLYYKPSGQYVRLNYDFTYNTEGSTYSKVSSGSISGKI